MNRARTCLFPFSASQYQELEHQVLIFKQMASGIPIPTDLLYAALDSPQLLLHHPPPSSHHNYGWSYSQLGIGRKIDPEPGRCRRTDGKKWRCGKEAYNDSKYCERHMHRGKNRSRKPVETNIQSSTALPFSSSLDATRSNNNTTYAVSNLSPSSTPSFQQNQSIHQQQHPYHGLYNNKNHQFSTVNDDNATSATNFMMESDPYSSLRQGAKIKVDEQPFLSETSSGRMRSCNVSATAMHDSSWLLTPLTMASPASYVKQNSYSEVTNTGTLLQLAQREDEQKNKVMHHFFDKQNERNFWHNTNDDDLSSNATGAASNIQLSISIPISSHDFFLTRDNEK